ncbi:S-layer homology domain-containing protein [Paraclostridium sordellii]|uniref:S-layer homology domain-containing protein n=1 Tax=Paraclostridium sordellii TaxID=1505 RepID=UPI0005E3B957|nr:S-layer homology domain-containing protein [Paeniclostridium sordellii]CEO20648.1 putative S-layer protein [[Clostridium] sordellii] [Paeniclostridium sordellii]
MKKIIAIILSFGIITSNIVIANASNKMYVEESSKPNMYKSSDILGHWAYNQINDFMNKGYINGYPDGTFRPENSITRAEFVKILNKTFNLRNGSGVVFNDTLGHWAKNEIDIAVTNGVCRGTSDTTFEPDAPITREQAAKMIANYKRITDTHHNKINNYGDGWAVSNWAKDAVESILEAGYMNGYSDDNTFRPLNNITRAEAVVTLGRVENNPHPVIPVPPKPGITDDTIVYTTPKGKSYHLTKDCVALKRSPNISSMTVRQAKQQGKTDPCNICIR